jgi:hypothetical protein
MDVVEPGSVDGARVRLKFRILVLRWVNGSGEWSSGSRPEIEKVICVTLLSIDPTRCEWVVTASTVARVTPENESRTPT